MSEERRDIPCFRCREPGAEDAQHEIITAVLAIMEAKRRGEPLPPRPDVDGVLPVNCCRRKPRLVE
jgi:hypothetical protein